MNEKVFLGIDLGAESGRVMAGLWDGNRMTLEEVHRFPNGAVTINGTLRWDLLRLWGEIQQGLTLAAKRYGKSIVSVGVDTWGVDFVLLSKTGELLGLPFHYRDERTRGVMDEAFKRVSREDIFAETGLQFMEFNTLYQLLALQKKSPELLEAADCFLTIPDFLNWCLTGRKVAEFTNATTTQCCNAVKRQWASGLLRRFDLPTSMFPEVIMPGVKLGPLQDSVARSTGLQSVEVVAVAAHDTGSAVVGVPTTNTGKANWAYISSGTWSLLGAEVQEAKLSARAAELNFTNEGGVDGTYRLLKNIMGLWLVQRCKRAFDASGGELSYAELVTMAESAPALRSLVDPDDPSFLNPPDMPRAIQDFCGRTGQPVPQTEGELVRCALESLALKYAIVLGRLEELTGERVEVIHIVGGGSRNELLNQFTADACQRPVLAGPVEATVLGNLMMQLRAAGQISSLGELRTAVRNSSELKEFLPNQKQAPAWEHARNKIFGSMG
ncbi:MAG: rhamnulokinase [Verrucomicrobia bacterium]|nr:rhamnulokinase [Verrucomicrobiota bacterium]